VPLSENWNWVSRLALPVVSVPVKREVGNLFQLDPAGALRPNGRFPSSLDPFGRTTGLGDLAYVGFSHTSPRSGRQPLGFSHLLHAVRPGALGTLGQGTKGASVGSFSRVSHVLEPSEVF
jgi:hypothetical protein